MHKTFENFVNNVVEWTPENPNPKIFYRLGDLEKKWIKIYTGLGLITKMLILDDTMHMWLSDGRVFTQKMKTTSHKTRDGATVTNYNFINRYHWDTESGLDKQYQAIKKKSKSIIVEDFDYAMSSQNYLRLIEELGLEDITTPKQKENGTFQFRSNRTYRPSMHPKDEPLPFVVYNVYSRGDVTVKQGYMPMEINRKRVNVTTWKDYLPLFDLIYDYEKKYVTEKVMVKENAEDDFEESMENEEDTFIPNDVLKLFSQEDQLAYALETHPDHDFFIFVGRPGYKDVVINGKKYKEEILEIETLCKVETTADAKQAGMMKIRAVSQGENSRVYGIWLPKGVFEEKYVYGSEIEEWMLPLIDQHKKVVA
jgi:hypothetical protein